MRDQQLRIDLVRLHGLQQHRRGDRIDQAGSDGDVAVPQPLEMQIGLDAVDADVGDHPAGCHDILAGDETGRHSYRLDGRVDPPAVGHGQNLLDRLSVGSVDRRAVAPKRLAISRRFASKSIMMTSAGE